MTGGAPGGVAWWRGTAAELHGRDPFAGGPPAAPVWCVCELTRPAVVLGSRQGPGVVDAAACAMAGFDVVRRRSGGGAVVLRPGEVVWIDLVAPRPARRGGIGDAGATDDDRDDDRDGAWDDDRDGAWDDVRASMRRVGERWRAAVAPWVASPDDLRVHAGGMVETAWSELLCFAGLGPGEVTLAGRKLVGLSQRRTRHGARVQGLVYTVAPRPGDLALLAAPAPGVPPAIATLPGATASELVARLAG